MHFHIGVVDGYLSKHQATTGLSKSGRSWRSATAALLSLPAIFQSIMPTMVYRFQIGPGGNILWANQVGPGFAGLSASCEADASTPRTRFSQ